MARVRTSRRRATLLAPLAALVCGGCFATRNDVRVLQADIATLRAERAYGDSARAAQIDRIISQMRVATDSIRSLAGQFGRFQGDAREALRGLQGAVVTIQELTGQSQRRMQEIRAQLEAQQAATAAADSSAAPAPNQLYQLARDQFDRGSYATARAGFEDLLRRYATADVAPDAQYYVGESYAAERNTSAADDAYAAVVTRYPSSPRASLALYKRARLQQTAGRTREARTLFDELIRRYPRSDEAELARDAIRTPARPRP